MSLLILVFSQSIVNACCIDLAVSSFHIAKTLVSLWNFLTIAFELASLMTIRKMKTDRSESLVMVEMNKKLTWMDIFWSYIANICEIHVIGFACRCWGIHVNRILSIKTLLRCSNNEIMFSNFEHSGNHEQFLVEIWPCIRCMYHMWLLVDKVSLNDLLPGWGYKSFIELSDVLLKIEPIVISELFWLTLAVI